MLYFQRLWGHLRDNTLFCFVCVGAGGLLTLLPMIPSFVIGVIVWLGLSAYSVDRWPYLNGWTMILGAALIIITIMGLPNALAVMVSDRADYAEFILVEAASNHPEALGFTFHQPTVHTEFLYKHAVTTRSKNSSPKTSYYYVAPLTDPSWQSGDPVPAWVVCYSSSSLGCDLGQGKLSAIRPHEIYLSNFEDARQKALSTHELNERPNAPLLELIESIDAARSKHLGAFAMPILMIYICVIVPLPFISSK